MWHDQARATATPLPDPIPIAEFTRLTDDRQDEYWTCLSASLPGLLVTSPAAQRASERLQHLIARNETRPPGAKSVIGINAPYAVGKSTFVKTWAHETYRERLGDAIAEERPTWQPEPGITADWVPQIYVTLRAASKIKDINAAILAFLGYPSEGLIRVTTTRVVKVLRMHGVTHVIVDDVHMLNTRHAHGRDVLDYLKFLNTELGELGGTLILVGAHLDGGPLYQDPQIGGRLDRITLAPYEIDTETGRRDWQLLLRQLEQTLLPYLDTTPGGTFAREHAGLMWLRTQGYVGDTVTLAVDALLTAFDDGANEIGREHLLAPSLSARAAAAEADLRTQHTARTSGRRTRQAASA